VLCHGVLGYVPQPRPLLDAICDTLAPAGLVSIMTANASTMAVRPALERRWADAEAAFDASSDLGVLGVPSRGDTVQELSAILADLGVEPVAWYGGWLFTDWLGVAGVDLDDPTPEELERIVAVEMEAARRDPYRLLSRVFHLVGRRRP
jgi:SAM-dependent methyltransferase